MVERLDELEHERAWPRSSAAAAEGWNRSWEENTARQFDPAPPPRISVAEENKGMRQCSVWMEEHVPSYQQSSRLLDHPLLLSTFVANTAWHDDEQHNGASDQPEKYSTYLNTGNALSVH